MIPSALDYIREIAGHSDRLARFSRLRRHAYADRQSSAGRVAFGFNATDAARAGRAVPVAILSGRDLDDVRRRVDIDGIVYAGSHGFDIAGARGLRRQLVPRILPKLDVAEAELREALG